MYSSEPKMFYLVSGDLNTCGNEDVLLFFTTLGLARFLKETAPQVEPPAEGQSSNAQAVQAVEAWKHSDFLCHNYVLNGVDRSFGNKKRQKEQNNDKKGKGKSEYLAPKAGIVKQKFQGTCYNCDQPGHRAANCKMPKRVNPRTNNSGWWIDTGATRHVCADKSMFHSFRAVDNGQKLYMGNSATADIKGEGDINGMLLGNAVDAMFKVNVMKWSRMIVNKRLFAYLIEVSNVWHGRLGHYCYVYLLKSKDEAIDKFVLYKTEVENQLGKKIKVVRSDRGGEYVAPLRPRLCCETLGIRLEFLLPIHLSKTDMWGEAILTATYLLNKIPRKEKEETPYELWMGRKPSYQYLRVWGCLAKVAVPTPKAQKIGPKSVDCIFIGYAKKSTAYRNGSSSRLADKVVQDRRARRDDRMKPTSFREAALNGSSRSKMKADGTVDKYKARVVIQGFRQREGLDYFDTYSPVTRITSIRMIIAIAALRNLEIHQMDVKTAFLNGDLEEEIYMNQPEGFIAPGQEGKVCRLVKSLYGLKQAPKQWHQKFDHTMLESGFKINECDKCVYVKDTSAGYVILCLYVDDMLIVGSNDKIIRSTKDMLKSKFDMKDMGLADDVIIGIKIIRNSE
ncbi:retrotransposon protein, putative, ty1-copia subclass [Tanacetum coccineum]|uniref:Retrotransposon protein, putative, ty1-copia subclass n=1 Tax=Tanacetum coccineum TaxID=301880 RepID=A0ABQ5IWK9_9ASTR